MATQATYCTERDLKDVFPEVDSYDTKTPIYGWTTTALDGRTYYISYDTGLVTQLFIDGQSYQSGKQTIGTSAATAINNVGAIYAASATTIVVDDGSELTDSTYIKIGDEILGITAISTNTITVTRGLLGTIASTIADNSSIYLHFQFSVEGEWLYDSDNDFIIMQHGSNPNDSLAEAGEMFSTLKTRYMKNASEWLDSRLDGTLPRERFKDQDGNYDYIIVRTSALLAAVFLIRSQDPTSEVASALFNEATDAIDKINAGQTKLSWQITQSDSQGVVRQTSDAGNLRIVDTRGHYVGTYDKIGVRITTLGTMGTAKYSVWASDGDKIGTEIMAETSGTATTNADITEVIDGMYQTLAGGLQIRFAGDTGDAAVAGDAWEIEVTGKYEAVDNARPKTIKMTRRGSPQSYKWQ